MYLLQSAIEWKMAVMNLFCCPSCNQNAILTITSVSKTLYGVVYGSPCGRPEKVCLFILPWLARRRTGWVLKRTVVILSWVALKRTWKELDVSDRLTVRHQEWLPVMRQRISAKDCWQNSPDCVQGYEWPSSKLYFRINFAQIKCTFTQSL